MKFLFYFIFITSIVGCNVSTSGDSTLSTSDTNSLTEIQKQLDNYSQRAREDLGKIPFDSLEIPRTIESDGEVKGTPSKSWTSGFYPGMLWQLYGHSKDEKLKEAALQWSNVVEKEKFDGGTHDLGFKIYCPFGNAYKITKVEKYKDVFVTAAKTLSTRYNPKVGAIRSWDHHAELWSFPVIIDNMMNLEMLFEATNHTGDSSFYHIADQHAKTTLKNHFRPDHSSYHVVSFDPETGEVENKNTHQGFGHESAWSRGQAWGLYGFATAYRYTKNPEFLNQAKEIANFIFNHPNLPEDLIPYWDFDAPNIPNEPRDVSAAAITASGLFELSKHDIVNAKKYQEWASAILDSLQSEKYQNSTAPFFLKHSVGSIPGKFEIDSPIIYADYYYVEALLRQKKAQM
ncbi:glycoside hydrolase family 88 protein [Saprospiraceae bacterium]|nr:glycoside hydrolase family 88 protein [Saprospiraceae bacterium]